MLKPFGNKWAPPWITRYYDVNDRFIDDQAGGCDVIIMGIDVFLGDSDEEFMAIVGSCMVVGPSSHDFSFYHSCHTPFIAKNLRDHSSVASNSSSKSTAMVG